MKITVRGKAHMEGTSKKTGRPYNMNQIHYLGRSPFVEGECAETLFLDPAIYPLDTIIVGMEYDVEFNNRGYVVSFTPVDRDEWEEAMKALQGF